MIFEKKELDDRQLSSLYEDLLYPRLIEEKMLLFLRQGKISKWFSGIGQEAIAVGATAAMEPEEWILPMHRNLGVFTTRNIPLHQLFLQWQGDLSAYTKGRERSFHFGDRNHFICGMISHLGPQLSVADGIALAYQLKKSDKACLVFTGEGGTSEGEFHEALNVASVWGLPVVFLVENNGYGLSTPVREQYHCEKISDRAKAYGMQGITIDGNNILEVYDTVKEAHDYAIREQQPVLIECMTFRMRGHEEASGVHYIPPELFAQWKTKDPIDNYGDFLLRERICTPEQLDNIRVSVKEKIALELKKAAEITRQQAGAVPDIKRELQDIYAPPGPAVAEVQKPQAEKYFIHAISEALEQAMQKYDGLILLGQDIAGYGGAFKVTAGFADTFGKDRVRNTPICESAVIGTALGLSLEGFKSVVEMQFADFAACGFNQIVNNLAKIHYRWGQKADVVIRMPTGAGVGAGPFHSQSNEAWFVHTPGLKVVYPAFPGDAKGLLLAAVEDPNPVLYFEHKALYRSAKGFVPEGYHTLEIGRAGTVLSGEEVSIVSYGMGVHWAMKYSQDHPEIAIDLTDLRTLLPLDYEALYRTVKKTGKVLILHEDTLTGGIGGEIAAWISENCFEFLDAPVMRCASLDTPVPFAPGLEKNFLAAARLEETMSRLMNY